MTNNKNVEKMSRDIYPKICLCTGCFDIVHIGHIRLLNYAAKISDRVVVGINSDDSVRRCKGEGRPINNQDDRSEFLLNLKSVSEVYIFDEDTPSELIGRIKPFYFLKGSDTDMNVLKYECRLSSETQIIQFDSLGGYRYHTTSIIEKIKNER